MMIRRNSRAYERLRLARSSMIAGLKGLQGAHRTAYIHISAKVSRDLVAGAYVFVGRRCKLDPGVVLGNYTMLASEVAIVGDDHNWDRPGIPIQFSGRPRQTQTLLEDDVWVGYRALIMRGVCIGRGSIIAAHAVVTADVEPYAVMAGVPARKIADRFSDVESRQRHDAMLNGCLAQPRFAEPLASLGDLA